MKLTKQEVVEKLKTVNKEFTEEKLDCLLDTFFNVENRPAINSKTFTVMRETTGLKFNGKYVPREIDALVMLGFELAPTKNEKTTKRYMVEQVLSKVRASKQVILKVYDNLIHPYRITADALHRKLPSMIGEGAHPQTIKKIESLFSDMGAKVKPIYVRTGASGGGTKGMKFNQTIVIDDGIVRWNPQHKLMPEAFKHLDNAW